MTAEQRVLAWIEHADFTGTGCRHSQDTIAKAVGCSRRTVIRAVQALAADGRITVAKERRPGCKWPSNVYRVRDWNPHKRVGVLNVLAVIREQRRTQCHTEENSTAVVGSYAPGTSSSVSPSTRCQHAAGARASRIARSACVCQNCTALREENAMLMSKLQKASDDLVGAAESQKAAGKELARLRRQLTDETTPLAQEVRRVLDHWGQRHPRANTAPTGSRARVVRGAYKLGHTDPPITCPVHDAVNGHRDKDAVCTVADELIEALDGLALMPFVGPHGRCAEGGPGRRRFDGIEYALTDRKTGAPSESTIERFRAYARWAKLAPSDKLLVAYEKTGDVHEMYTRYLMDALARENGNGNGVHA